mgnify:CR=1 FL=1
MTIEAVKSDLKEVKFYYAHREIYARALAESKNQIVKLVGVYEDYMEKAPAELFALYHCLIIEGKSRNQVIDEWHISLTHLKMLYSRLCLYLADVQN